MAPEKLQHHESLELQPTGKRASAVAVTQKSGKFWRYTQAILCCFLNIVNCSQWVSYAPIPQQTAEFYQTSTTAVNLLSVVYTLMYVFGSPVSASVLDGRGPRAALLIGALLTFVGTLIRWVGSYASSTISLPLAFVGQILLGIGQPFLLNAPTKISAVWFDEKERALWNGIMTVGNPAGSLMAYALNPVIAVVASDVPTLLLIWFIVAAAFLVLAFFLARDPLDLKARLENWEKEEGNSKTTTFRGTLFKIRVLFATGPWIAITIGFSIAVSLFNAFATLLTQFVLPFGYTVDDGSIFGAILILCGIISSGVAGTIADRTLKHNLIIKIMVCLTGLTYVFVAVVVPISGLMPVLTISFALLGLCSFAMLPVALELAAYFARHNTKTALARLRGRSDKQLNSEDAFAAEQIEHVGIPEGLTVALMWMLAQLLGVVFTLSFDAAASRYGTIGIRGVLWASAASVLILAVMLVFFLPREALKRASEIVGLQA